MTVDLNMFGTLMKDRVGGDVESGLIVAMKLHRLAKMKSEGCEETSQTSSLVVIEMAW